MQVNISPSLEDYLEGILILQETSKVVRVKDLAEFLEVKSSSAVESLTKLKDSGLINQEKYGFIGLTNDGLDLAKKVYSRHNALKKFFNHVLEISEPVAEEDACKIEHYLSEETINRISKFIEFVDAAQGIKPEWLNNFYNFANQ